MTRKVMIVICYDKRDYCTPSLTNYYGHLVIILRMSRLPYFKVIAQHCIVRICGMITKNPHLAKFVLHSIMQHRKIFGLAKRSSASTMYANNNICNFETTLRKNSF